MRLRVVWIGKTRQAEARAWGDEYAQRIRRFARLETEELTDKQGDVAVLKRAETARLVALDPAGKPMSSEQLARFLAQQFERDGRELIFAVGGAEGFSEPVRRRADTLLSLSPMTFSHELARVMVLEQLYRALTILNNHPYAK